MLKLLAVIIKNFFLVIIFIIEGIYPIIVLVHIFILFLAFFLVTLVDGRARHILGAIVRIW